MKKKITALILLSVFSAIVFAGCSSDSTPTWQTDKSAPWYNNNRYERIEYDYSRYTLDDGGYTDIKVASGKYVTEMVGIKDLRELDGIVPYSGLSLTDNSNYSYTLLKSSLEITYNDGAADCLYTNLLYYTMDMLPIYLVKRADYGSTGTKYGIETDYTNLTNTGLITEDGVTNEFNAPVDKKVSSEVFDSDLLYYAARARSSLASGSPFTFSIYSPVDSALTNKKKSFSMYFKTDSAYIAVDKDDKFIKNCYTQEAMPAKWTNSEGKVTGEGYKLPATRATVSINATKTGTYTYLFYSDDDFNVMGMTMSKALLYMQKDEYDTRTSTAKCRNIYQISDYSISR